MSGLNYDWKLADFTKRSDGKGNHYMFLFPVKSNERKLELREIIQTNIEQLEQELIALKAALAIVSVQ